MFAGGVSIHSCGDVGVWVADGNCSHVDPYIDAILQNYNIVPKRMMLEK
jgi:hypothetical protein